MPKASLLIVEDEHVVALDLQRSLENSGYRVVGQADRGEDAIQRAETLRPDLVLMDIGLKGDVDGIEAATQIRARLHLPVIFLTAFADEATVRRARPAEPYGYILKPFDERELASNIEMALYKHGAETNLRESEARFRGLFEYSPISLWEEDFSGVKAFVDELRQRGITDLEGYLASHPEAVDECLRRIKVLDVNQATVKLYGAQNKEQLLSQADQVFGPETRRLIAAELAALVRGEREFESEGVNHKLTGERMEVSLRWFVPSAHAQDLSQVVVSILDTTARKRAEAAQRKSEALYRDLVETSQDLIWRCDAEGRYTYLNPAWETVFGYPLAQMLGRSFTDFQAPAYAARDRQEFARLLEGGSVHEFETVHLGQGGREIHLVFNAKFVRDERGQVAGTCGTAYDITARKRAEAALRESETRFRALFEQAALGVAQIDTATGRFVRINQKYCDLVGYSRAEMEQLDFQTITHPADLALDLAHMERLKAGEIREFTMEKRYYRKDGSLIWVSLTVSPLWAPGAAPDYHIGIVQDISERVRTEEKLRESEAKLRIILDATPFPVALVDLQDDHIDFWSHSALDLFGHTAPTAAEWYQLAYPDPAYRRDVVERWRPAVDKARGSGQAVNAGEYRVACRDGSERICELYATFFADNLIVTFSDITERKQAEAKVLHLARLYATLSQINQTIVRAPDRDALFLGICRAAVEQGQFRMVWMGLVDPSDGHVRPVAFAGEEQGYLTDLRIAVHDPELGGGPTGTAIREGRCNICQDIANDPRMSPWREPALQRGYGSSAAVPIRSQTGLLGALTVYAPEPQGFGEDDRKLLDEIGEDISYALDAMDSEADRQQAEAKLSQALERLELAARAARLGIWDWDIPGNKLVWDDQMYALYGLHPRDFAGAYEAWLAGLHPDDLAASDEVSRQAQRGEREYDTEFRVVWPDGTVRTLKAYGIIERDAAGAPRRMTGVNYDITERVRSEQERQQAADEIRRRSEELAALNTLGRQVSQTLSLEAVVSAAVKAIVEVTQTDVAYLFLREGNRLVLAGIGPQSGKEQFGEIPEHRVGECMCGLAVIHGKPLYSRDIYTDRRCTWDECKKAGYRSFAALPLRSGTEIMGVAGLACRAERDFESQAGFLETLASQVAGGLRNAQLYEQTRRRLNELDTIHQTAQRLQVLHTPESLAQTVIRLFEENLDYEYGAVLLLDEQSGRLAPFALSEQGRGAEFLERDKAYVASQPVQVSKGITGWVAQTGQSVCLGDVRQDARYLPMRADICSELCVPLRVGGAVIGVVNIETSKPKAYTADDQRVLETIAAQIAVALQNARLLEQVQGHAAELEQRVAARTAELQSANAALLRAGRLKDEFLANMSHELRTPLTGVLGLTEVMQQGIYGDLNEKQRYALTQIRASGDHLLQLINDILDLSKLEVGKVELQIAPVVIDEVCQASLGFVKQAAHKKNLRLSFQSTAKVGWVPADERRLKQMLVNLLGNAVKFTPEGGQVGLEVTSGAAADDPSDRQQVLFTVGDTGIGIAPEQQALLFQPFVQLDGSLARKYEGTGLGLALVRSLAELHGGSVTVESAGLGQGTRFTITLPCTPSDEVKADSLRPSAEPPAPRPASTGAAEASSRLVSLAAHLGRPPVILAADDNPTTLTVLANYLEASGCRVVTARDGAEALAQAEAAQLDLIVLDIHMPDLDGLTVVRRLRAEGSTVPVIALTALAMPGDRERCLEAGANDYLSKPVKLAELTRAIARLLELKA